MKNSEDIFLELKNTNLFKFFPDKDLKNILGISKILKYSAGDRIINEHDVGESIFLIIEGGVEVFATRDEKDVHICNLDAGEFFGESGFFLKVKRNASIKANTETILVEIERDFILKYIKENSVVGNQFLLIVIFSLLKKLRSTNIEVGSENLLDVNQDDIDKIIGNVST